MKAAVCNVGKPYFDLQQQRTKPERTTAEEKDSVFELQKRIPLLDHVLVGSCSQGWERHSLWATTRVEFLLLLVLASLCPLHPSSSPLQFSAMDGAPVHVSLSSREGGARCMLHGDSAVLHIFRDREQLMFTKRWAIMR
eukprot:CAMPEP_0194027090 /NCGR_PEP_ID=MMETSP0009_2-20130614/1312_1 /TAXON_ID=210454 /ORGANISM="Grammatophora oceanica, Strain CCMP 410" /LENGTH=138 /DNA_ID=CAMNT_0038666037 /DNA_START=1 /DNA_END=417 /DNA_ORIENTATION=+